MVMGRTDDGRPSPRVLKVDPLRPQREVVEEAGRALREGLLVAFPTETVYGLGAHALKAEAVARVFLVKGRPPDNPVIVHVGYPEDVEVVAREVPKAAFLLMARFWPGPLTLVLPRSPAVPDVTTAGLDTVAVRMPSHPVALAIIRAAGVPVAAPSANRSGGPSPTRAEHVLEDLGPDVDVVVDGGPCPIGVESTVLDLTGEEPLLLRPGGVAKEALEAVLGRPIRLGRGEEAARSPGTRHRHYAPRAQVMVVPGPELEAVARRFMAQGKRVGVIATRPIALPAGCHVRVMTNGLPQYARELFHILREMDRLGCDVVIAEAVEEKGLGLAIMDRLRRAAAR
jgi:L-threonylcarbamoyladenylate synthase